MYLSQYCKPEAQRQGVSRAIFPLKTWGKSPSLSGLAPGGCQQSLEVLPCTPVTLISASVFTSLCPCVSLCPNFPLKRTPDILDLIQYDLTFSWLHLQRPYLQIRPHSQVVKEDVFWGNAFQSSINGKPQIGILENKNRKGIYYCF